MARLNTPTSRLPLALLAAVVLESLGMIFRLILALPAADSRRGHSTRSGGWRRISTRQTSFNTTRLSLASGWLALLLLAVALL